MNIEEGNKLIAEFMKSLAINSPHLKLASELQYHTSWDWLMPVVEKIESMGYPVCINERSCCITDSDGHFKEDSFEWVGMEGIGVESKIKIEAVWQAVVEFVKVEI